MNSDDVGIISSSVDCEAMRDTLDAYVPRNSTESENRETAIGVVWFNNLAHIKKGSLVLIWALADVMKRAL